MAPPYATPAGFWEFIDRLVESSELVIDRPKGSIHPRFPALIYPLDYGYLASTTSMDQAGIDVWVGNLPTQTVNAIVVTVDLLKRDSEIKLLLACQPKDFQTILAFHSSDLMQALLITRD